VRFKTSFHEKYVWCWIFLVCVCLIKANNLIGKKVGIGGSWFLKKAWSVSPTFYFLSLCLIGAIIEEFIFRYLVFKIFGKKDKRLWLSFFVSFFAFIFAHRRVWEDFRKNFPWLAFSAFSFIFIYWLSDWNLLFPIFLHVLFNTIVAIFFIYQH